MKLYIASSWKNQNLVLSFAEWLRREGHEVDAFCDASSGRMVFDAGTRTAPCDAITFLKDERAQQAFAEDKRWLDWCEGVLLLLPAGRSAHLEAGYAKGQGKRLWIVGLLPPGECDVMYGFADGLFYLTAHKALRDAIAAAGGPVLSRHMLKTIDDGYCPDCGARWSMLKGPEGGLSVNVKCSQCGSAFNLMPGIGAERIGKGPVEAKP